jgi:ABC-type transporter Mla subunit MlaD
MDERQQQQVNEAAQQFADALTESFRTVTERSVSVQQLNAELTQSFFNRVINNLQTQAEDTKQMTEQLAEQQQRVTETGQTLTKESVGAYMDFVNSMFSFYQDSVQATQRGTREAGGYPERGEEGITAEGDKSTDHSEYFRNLIEETNRRSGLGAS